MSDERNLAQAAATLVEIARRVMDERDRKERDGEADGRVREGLD